MWCYPPLIDVETQAQRHKAAWHAHITIKGQERMIQTSSGLYLQLYLKAQWSDGWFFCFGLFGLFLPSKRESYLTDDTSLSSRIVSAVFPAPSTMAGPKPAAKNYLRWSGGVTVWGNSEVQKTGVRVGSSPTEAVPLLLTPGEVKCRGRMRVGWGKGPLLRRSPGVDRPSQRPAWPHLGWVISSLWISVVLLVKWE